MLEAECIAKLLFLGFAVMFLLAVQTRLLVKNDYMLSFGWVFITAVVWFSAMSAIAKDDSAQNCCSYALGNATGAIVGMWIDKRFLCRSKTEKVKNEGSN